MYYYRSIPTTLAYFKSAITCDGDENSLSHCTSTSTSDGTQPICNNVILYCSGIRIIPIACMHVNVSELFVCST